MKLDTSATIPKVDSFSHAPPSGRVASSQRGQLAGTPEHSASIPGAEGLAAAQPFDLLLSLLIESSMSTGAAPAAASPVTAEGPSKDDPSAGDGVPLAAALPWPGDSVSMVVPPPFAPDKQGLSAIPVESVAWTSSPMLPVVVKNSGGTPEPQKWRSAESFSGAPCCTKTVAQIERGASLGGGISPTGSPAVTGSETTSPSESPRIENSPVAPASHSVSSLPPPALNKSWPDRLPNPTHIERTNLVFHHDPDGNGSDRIPEPQRESTNKSDSHSATTSHTHFERSQANMRLDLPMDSFRLEPQPVAPVSVSDQLSASLSHRIEQRSGTERFEFQMRFDPPELGTVHVHVSVVEDSVSIRLVASDETARRLIERQLTDLRQSLGQWGLSFGQCDVSCGGGRKHDGRHELEAPVPRSKTSVPSVQWTGRPHTSRAVSSSHRRLDYWA